jgi:hypothetical protein
LTKTTSGPSNLEATACSRQSASPDVVPASLDQVEEPSRELAGVVARGEDEMDLVRVEKASSLDSDGRRVETRAETSGQEARQHGREVIEEPIVERQQTRVGRQAMLASGGGDDVAHGAHAIVTRDVVELAVEGIDRQRLQPGVAASRQISNVVIHDDRERAHRVNTARNAELQVRLTGADSSGSSAAANRL